MTRYEKQSRGTCFGDLVPGDMIVTPQVNRLVLSVVQDESDTVKLTMMCFGSLKKIPPWMTRGRIYSGTYRVSSFLKDIFVGFTTVLRAIS